MTKQFYSHGKLLITAEYAVLDGALALAIPTVYGQFLNVSPSEDEGLHWSSYDVNDEIWYQGSFGLQDTSIIQHQHNSTSNTLFSILQKAKTLNPEFLSHIKGVKVTTKLEFPNNWGLGSSSTLINNIAQWAGVNPFNLLDASFGGSGYDIAAAKHDRPILYKRSQTLPETREVHLPWNFTENIFFVHLNHKQDSRKGVERYRSKKTVSTETIGEISHLTELICGSKSLTDFINYMQDHERLISELIGLPTIKESLFSDYKGLVKSLGAWGGDFVLVTGSALDMIYFGNKGFRTIIPFSEMIK